MAHLASVGVAAGIDEVETSALTTASALRERSFASAAVIGEEGLRTALASAGIELVTPMHVRPPSSSAGTEG